MPYFRWRGVDIEAGIHTGTLYARSQKELDLRLFERGIALLSAAPEGWRGYRGPVRLRHIVPAFRQLSVLVSTGVLVPDALSIVADQVSHRRLRDVMHSLADAVSSGNDLSTALTAYPKMFNTIIIQLIEVGERSGTMAHSLESVCAYLARVEDMHSRVTSALLLPCITLGFFFLISGVIFVLVMPHFASFFSSMGHQLPLVTRIMIGVSNFLRSPAVVVAGGILGGLVVGFGAISRVPAGRKVRDWLFINMPVLGSVLYIRFVSYLLHVLSLMLDSGVALVDAMAIVGQSVDNQYLRAQVVSLETAVGQGIPLSEAMRVLNDRALGEDLIAMVRVGEESGRLALVLERSAQVYHGRVMQALKRMTTMIQPILMLVLGILITMLVFAVYGPIMTMASIV